MACSSTRVDFRVCIPDRRHFFHASTLPTTSPTTYDASIEPRPLCWSPGDGIAPSNALDRVFAPAGSGLEAVANLLCFG